MKYRHLVLFGVLVLFCTPLRAQDFPLLPYPQRVVPSGEAYRIDSTVYLRVSNKIDSNLKHYVYWAGGRMAQKTQKMLAIDLERDSTYNKKGIWIFFDSLQVPCVKANEGYRIDVSKNVIKVCASTSIGTMRAMETLTQLVAKDEKGYYIPGVTIEDKPRYNWRGLLIDVSRHFMPMPVLYRNIDAMAMAKMNVLHLHLSDDQGFRIESKLFPALHQKGSSGGEYYTQAEMIRLIDYAADRGIRVVPEFDLPAHASSWLAAYPELGSAYNKQEHLVEKGYGIFDPALDPSNEKVYDFLGKFFGEMATVFKDSCVHIGGDEVTGVDWKHNPLIQHFMKERGMENTHDLQAYFNQKVEAILFALNKKMIGWDEILDGKPSKTTIVQSWRGEEAMNKAMQQGYQVIRSNGYYLDQTYTAGEYYVRRNTADTNKSGRVLGLEGAMWAELVDSITADSRLWPNTAAVAELGWTSSPFDSIHFYKRLIPFSQALDDAGIHHEAYVHQLVKPLMMDKDEEELLLLCDYMKPLGGYGRHKTLKKRGVYNASVNLRTEADMARPTSLAYLKLVVLVSDYIKQPESGTKTKLNAIFHDWMHQYEVLQRRFHKDQGIAHWMEASSSLAAAGRIGLHLLKNDVHHKEKLAQDLLHLEKKLEKHEEYTLQVLFVLKKWAESH